VVEVDVVEAVDALVAPDVVGALVDDGVDSPHAPRAPPRVTSAIVARATREPRCFIAPVRRARRRPSRGRAEFFRREHVAFE
jgi:hypothetical protein